MRVTAYFVVMALLYHVHNGFSQKNVGIGTVSPHASSILELNSSNKGFLVPRISLLSETDASTILSPAYSFDTFIVIRTRFDKPGTKAIAKDTFVLIEKEFPPQVTVTRARHWYHMEAVPYDQNDTSKTAGVKKDTVICTWKPYKP